MIPELYEGPRSFPALAQLMNEHCKGSCFMNNPTFELVDLSMLNIIAQNQTVPTHELQKEDLDFKARPNLFDNRLDYLTYCQLSTVQPLSYMVSNGSLGQVLGPFARPRPSYGCLIKTLSMGFYFNQSRIFKPTKLFSS